jgi:hypothetical protein
MLAQKHIDKIGMVASSACAVHCLFGPVLITLAPLIGLGFLFDEKIESIFILLSCGLAFLSLVWGFYKSHRNFIPFFVLLLGYALVTISRIDSVTKLLPEPFVMGFAGLSIALSHWINLKLCKSCHSCDNH